MGKNISRSYKEQKKAIEEKEVSFDLNLYFIGEDIKLIYERFESLKSQNTGDIYSFWNYFYHKGEYKSQLEEIGKLFKKKQEKFEEDCENNSFKEVIIVKMKERDQDKIDEIFEVFASDKKDVYCPFIIFFFDNVNDQLEKVCPDEETYYISPMKVLTFKFDTLESQSSQDFFKCLWRICSYYNELGEQFLIWPKVDNKPFAYDLIKQEFNSYINIFCLGKTGSGKSTFLNKFFGLKKSKQGGTGKSTTSKVVRFGIDGVPIRIYDIPGFEGEETIEIVNNKLNQIAKEMNSDKDKIHLILYFINSAEETILYEMEYKIIETLKTNNKDIKIIFVMTHSNIDPYTFNDNGNKKVKLKKKIDSYRDRLKKTINIISSTFGETYSYKNNYFQKDSLIQKNLIFVNLEKNYETEIEPFGFDKVIKSIYDTLVEGNDVNQLIKIKEKLAEAIINKIQDDEEFNKEIENCLSKGYILNHTTFALQKEKVIKEAQKLYDGMFSLGMNLLTITPVFRDVKVSAISYHKMQFKKQLNLIFGFNIKNEKFDQPDPNETEYEKINREYFEKIESEKEKKKQEKLVNEVQKDCIANEVSSSWIVANEVAGYVSYICLFGGPVLLPIGAIGVVGTSYVSYKQFEKDCTEYFEQYKKHYEEFKYYSLYHFINCIILGIDYLENYIVCLEDKAAPNASNAIENVKKSIEQDFKTAKEKTDKPLEDENVIKRNISFMN